MSATAAPAAASTPAQLACEYARLGLRIVPLYGVADGRCECGDDHQSKRKPPHGRGKHPRVKDWANAASADPAIVERWARQWPRMNTGAATGAGIFDVEIDLPKGGGEWEQANLDRLPATWMFTSGTGGHHRLYRAPADVPITTAANVLAPGVDVRGDGGQCVLPPSTHYSGARYEWVAGHSPWERKIADAPAWLVEKVRTKEAPAPAPASYTSGPSTISDLDLALAAQRSKIGALWSGHIPDGKTHSELDFRAVQWLLWRNGGDMAQADRVFRMAPAFRPDRWDSRNAGGTYGSRTLGNALADLNGQCYVSRRRPTLRPVRHEDSVLADPTLGQLDQAIAARAAGDEAADPETGEIFTAADLMALLVQARERLAVVEAQNTVLREREAKIRAVLLENPYLQPNDRLHILRLQFLADDENLQPGDCIDVTEPALAERWAISTDTAGGALDRLNGVGLQLIHHAPKSTPIVGADGKPIKNKAGRNMTDRCTVLELKARPFDRSVVALRTELHSPVSADGNRHGGARKKLPACPHCGGESEQFTGLRCKKCHKGYTAKEAREIKRQKHLAFERDDGAGDVPANEKQDAFEQTGAESGKEQDPLSKGSTQGASSPTHFEARPARPNPATFRVPWVPGSERTPARRAQAIERTRVASYGNPADLAPTPVKQAGSDGLDEQPVDELAGWPAEVSAHICEPPPGAPPRPWHVCGYCGHDAWQFAGGKWRCGNSVCPTGVPGAVT